MFEAPRRPTIYEINAWTWLTELSLRYHREITLATMPQNEWDALTNYGSDIVWLMGVWQRSPAGKQISLETPALVAEYRNNLPDYRPEDVSGSPYCIRDYTVDPHLGGADALAVAREELGHRGLGLMLDYVPNHVAPDHSWISAHSDYFIQGAKGDDRRDPAAFFAHNGDVIARGRDPYFAPWPDTAQLNAYNSGLRAAVIATLNQIADQCDGVRCDMAMLLINDIFGKTWDGRAGSPPATEYWYDVIRAVKKKHPGFLFVAEAYWDLESRLQQLGFDYCYDKRLYDLLEHGSAQGVHDHLLANAEYQEKLVRFLENHDEPRAAATLSYAKERAAAVVIMTLPGAKLLHEGQFEGKKVKLSVHLGRRPEEAVNDRLKSFYRKLVHIVRREDLRDADWQLAQNDGWPDNQSCRNLVSWCWTLNQKRYAVVVNFSDYKSQARVKLPWAELSDRRWQLDDLISGNRYVPRDGSEMLQAGLYVDLEPWRFHFLSFSAIE
jgi:glycosidase